MFDFDALPQFDCMEMYWRRAGIRPKLTALAVALVMVQIIGLGMSPWLELFLGRITATEMDDVLYDLAFSPSFGFLFLVPLGYVAYSVTRHLLFFSTESDFVPFKSLHGQKLLQRGDDVAKEIDALRRSYEQFVKWYGKTPEPGSPGDHVRQWLEKRWWAVRKAAWDLHREQMELRVRHAH